LRIYEDSLSSQECPHCYEPISIETTYEDYPEEINGFGYCPYCSEVIKVEAVYRFVITRAEDEN
jgi:hypothetical protein